MSDSAKEAIIKAANHYFSTEGYDATSVRDISERAKVNVASISYYFGSKQGLFEFMVQDFASNKLALVVSNLEPPKSLEEFRVRLSMFMKQFLMLSLSEKDSFRVMNKNLEVFVRCSPDLFEETFKAIHMKFISFVESAQKAKVIKSDASCEMIAQILFGGLIEFVRGSEFRKALGGVDAEDPKNFEIYINTVIDGFLNGMGVKN